MCVYIKNDINLIKRFYISFVEEPIDDYLYIAEEFNMSENLTYSDNVTPTQEDQLNQLTNDFHVVDEHENIITITATDLSTNNTELAYMQKFKQNVS